MAPSGECLRGYKPCAADCSRLVLCVAASCLPKPSCYTWPACRYSLCCLTWQFVCMHYCIHWCIDLFSCKAASVFNELTLLYFILHTDRRSDANYWKLMWADRRSEQQRKLIRVRSVAWACHAKLCRRGWRGGRRFREVRPLRRTKRVMSSYTGIGGCKNGRFGPPCNHLLIALFGNTAHCSSEYTCSVCGKLAVWFDSQLVILFCC